MWTECAATTAAGTQKWHNDEQQTDILLPNIFPTPPWDWGQIKEVPERYLPNNIILLKSPKQISNIVVNIAPILIDKMRVKEESARKLVLGASCFVWMAIGIATRNSLLELPTKLSARADSFVGNSNKTQPWGFLASCIGPITDIVGQEHLIDDLFAAFQVLNPRSCIPALCACLKLWNSLGGIEPTTSCLSFDRITDKAISLSW